VQTTTLHISTALVFSSALVLTAGSTIGPKAPGPVPNEIERLDQCIQVRFLDMRVFGMRRVLPRLGAVQAPTREAYHRIHNFEPENSVESAVVNDLKAKGYDVVFYLAGRGALQPDANDPRRSGVQGPAFITPLRDDSAPSDLLADARVALKSFDSGEGYSIRKGDWTVAMRPLRANQGQCISCHASQAAAGFKVGDALGIAMYVYRQHSAAH
jgi:hypothetical protein